MSNLTQLYKDVRRKMEMENLSYQDVENTTGISKGHVHKMLNDKSVNPSLETFQQLLRFAGKTWSDYLDADESTAPQPSIQVSKQNGLTQLSFISQGHLSRVWLDDEGIDDLMAKLVKSQEHKIMNTNNAIIIGLGLILQKGLDGTFELSYEDHLNGWDVSYAVRRHGVYRVGERGETPIDDFPAELAKLFERVQGQVDKFQERKE